MAGSTTDVMRKMEAAKAVKEPRDKAAEQYKRALRLLLLTNTIRSAYEYAKTNGALSELEDLAFPEAEKISSAVAMLALEALQYPVTFGDISRRVGKATTPLSAASELWDTFRSLRAREHDFSRQRVMLEMMRGAEYNEPFGSRMRFVGSAFLKCLSQTATEDELQAQAHYRLCENDFSPAGFVEWVELLPLSDRYLVYDVVRFEAHDPGVSARARQVLGLLNERLKP